ncbi:MAG: hypothetical protein ACXABY_19185 [Candidatus Thorarchaeota archaeon]|jgi:alpha-tubulin suppressor-like RCC1 family protein
MKLTISRFERSLLLSEQPLENGEVKKVACGTQYIIAIKKDGKEVWLEVPGYAWEIIQTACEPDENVECEHTSVYRGTVSMTEEGQVSLGIVGLGPKDPGKKVDCGELISKWYVDKHVKVTVEEEP